MPRKGLLPSLHPLPTIAAELHSAVGAILRVGVPDSAGLAGYEHSPWDQGDTETCWAHSAEHGIYTALAAMGRKPSTPFSPAALARCGYAMMRGASTPVGATFPKLTDSGADDTTTFAALSRYGLVPVEPLIPGRNSDADGATVTREPSLPDLEAAMPVVGPYAIDPGGGNVSDIVAAAIVAGHPVWVGAGCSDAEEQWAKGAAPLDAPPADAPGHATLIDSYNTVGGVRVFGKLGSWGASYGNAGRCLVSVAWLQAAWWMRPMIIGGA